jgi:hypothetical protein
LGSVPLILMSSLGNPGADIAGADEIDAVLSKPVHRRHLQDTLLRLKNDAFRLRRREASTGKLAEFPVVEKAPSLRVLVVEDNAVNQKMAMLTLRRFGIKADLASERRRRSGRRMNGAARPGVDGRGRCPNWTDGGHPAHPPHAASPCGSRGSSP